MKENLEEKWEREVNKIVIEKGGELGYMVEKNWRNYLKYFLLYFYPHIKKDNSKTFLLDIGCGPGFVLKELVQHEFKLYGVDFSSQMVEFAKTGVTGVNFQRSSIYQIPFPDEMFDIIICLGVFQTVTDPEAALSEISRVLKKEGLFVIRTLNKLSLSYYKTKKDNPEYFFYNPFLFKKELERMGFKVSSIKGIYFFPKKLHFLMDLIIKTKLYKFFNLLFFPLFVFFAHSFYIEAVKK